MVVKSEHAVYQYISIRHIAKHHRIITRGPPYIGNYAALMIRLSLLKWTWLEPVSCSNAKNMKNAVDYFAD